MESKYVALVIIAGLIIGYMVVADSGYLGNDEPRTTTTPIPQPTPATTSGVTVPASSSGTVQVLTGDFSVKVQVVDTNDQTLQRVDGTNINILYYQLKGDDWLWKGTSGATTANEAVIGLDETLTEVHAMLEIPDGQNFLVDVKKTNNQFSRIGTAMWGDPDNDGILDPVIPINIVGIAPVGNDPPTINWTVYLHTDDGNLVTLTSPPDTDTDNLGMGRADCAIDWELQFSDNARSFLVKDVELIVNGTNDDIYSLTNSYVDLIYQDGSKRYTFNSMDSNVDNFNSEIEYKRTFGEGEVADGKLFTISNSENILKRSIPVNIETDFGASDSASQVTLKVGLMDAQGELHKTVSDTVICAK